MTMPEVQPEEGKIAITSKDLGDLLRNHSEEAVFEEEEGEEEEG
jgi:hypothetical protein